MSYHLNDLDGNLLPIQILGRDSEGRPEWKQPFRPDSWVNDACNLPSRRWRVVSHGHETYYAWYEISVVGEESAAELVCKMARAAEIDEAYESLRVAQKRVHDLTHGWI